MAFLNTIISMVLVPLFFCPYLPFIHIAKMVYPEKEVISLSENGVGSAEDPVYLTAHRGITAVAPENTIPSYEKAVELGFYSAECDVQLTSDGYWVLNHNSDTDKMFCQYAEISETTLEELRSYSYKYGANFWQEGLKIATLEEYLDVFVGSSTRPQIELKTDHCEKLDVIVDELIERDMCEQAIIISFDINQLKAVHEYASSKGVDIELWYLCDEITDEVIATASSVGGNMWLSASFEKNTTASIQKALDAGIGVSLWTVNTVEDAKMLYDMGVRYIETDILCN